MLRHFYVNFHSKLSKWSNDGIEANKKICDEILIGLAKEMQYTPISLARVSKDFGFDVTSDTLYEFGWQKKDWKNFKDHFNFSVEHDEELGDYIHMDFVVGYDFRDDKYIGA